MKNAVRIGVFCVVALTLGCGKSATDAEKLTAQQALGVIMSKTPSTAERLRQFAERKKKEFAVTGCMAGETDDSGLHIAITCPDGASSDNFSVTITGASFSGTCGTTAINLANVSSTISFSESGTDFTFSFGISLTVNDLPFSCNMAVTASAGASSANYDCKINNGDIPQEAWTDLTGICT